MNYSTAILLVMGTQFRAIKASYELDAHGKVLPAQVRTFKTWDSKIKVGDFVVVPTDTRHNMTVCRVEEVDVDVDFDSTVQVSWVIGRVDVATHASVVAQEEAAIQAIRSAEVRRKREELADKLLADNPAVFQLRGVSAHAAPLSPPVAPEPYAEPAPRPHEVDGIDF